MKYTTNSLAIAEKITIDAIAEKEDIVDVEIQERTTGLVLYVNINGLTILRIGHIKNEIEVKRED